MPPNSEGLGPFAGCSGPDVQEPKMPSVEEQLEGLRKEVNELRRQIEQLSVHVHSPTGNVLLVPLNIGYCPF